MAGDGWTTTRLGDVANINPDAIGRDWPHTFIHYIDISSVGEGQIQVSPQLMTLADAPSRAKRLLRTGDTVLSTVRPNRRSMFFAAQPEDDWVVSTGFAVLRPQVANIAPRFLYACVFNQLFTEYLISREKGAAYPAVSPEDIANAVIPLPPLQEQQAIACILGALDDKIELNRRMNRTLEATAQAIFKSWFIDFEPVRRNVAQARNQPSPRPSPKGRGGGQYRGGYDYTGLIETVRELRKKQTSAELMFWELVRDRRFMGLKFRRQHQLGDYITDFYCHERRLVVEFDGDIHKSKKTKDHKRDAWMKAQNFTVMRFPNEQLLDAPESVFSAIAKATNPSPDISPLPLGEGGRRPGEGCAGSFDALFPDAFEDSELGEIPSGWRVGRIADIAHINSWSLGSKDTLQHIDYVEISEVMRGEIATITPYSRGEEPSRARRRLKHGDTAISTVRPDRGAFFLALNPPQTLIASTGFAVLTPKTSNWAFLHVATTRPEFGQELGHLADGGAYPAVRPEVITGRALVIPSDSRPCDAFDKVVQPLFLRIETNRTEFRTLAALRDALLPKLISGELRVSDAERLVGRCA